MANKKLQQLKFNLYSPGSGLTQLKVRESNSSGWYVMSRQSPLGSSGTWLYMLPTQAHSMFSGNNNTSHRLTAYLCKNPASGGIWNALALFFEISFFRYVLLVVVFSLPYQFSRDGKFYYREYLVCHTEMPSSSCCIWKGGQRNSSLFLKQCVDSVLVLVRKKDMFSLKKNTKARSREMTNLSLFVIGIYWLPLVHWLFITRGSTTVSKQGKICFSHLLWNIWSWSSLHSMCAVCAQFLRLCQQRFLFFCFFFLLMHVWNRV